MLPSVPDFFLEPGPLLRVAAREGQKLLRRDVAQYDVLVQPLEDGIQLPNLFLKSVQFSLSLSDLSVYLRRLPAADVCHKFLGVLPGLGGHPLQILQHYLIQDALPDIMGGADLLTLLLVGAAGKVVIGPAHGMCPVQHHDSAVVGAHRQARTFVLLVHVGAPPLMLPYPLDDVPGLPVYEGLMAAFDDRAFAPPSVYPCRIWCCTSY